MKNTKLINEVKDILKNYPGPISASQIMKNLNSAKIFPNKTSVYRILQKLEKNQQISLSFSKNRTSFYEWQSHHHHHFSCQKCQKIKCLESSEIEEKIKVVENLLQEKGFSDIKHHFHLTGHCPNCS